MANIDVPQGSNGGDSSRVLSYVQAMYQGGGIETDILLLNCGLHDIKTDKVTGTRQVELDTYVQNLRKILILVNDMGVKPVWIRTTPLRRRNSQFLTDRLQPVLRRRRYLQPVSG